MLTVHHLNNSRSQRVLWLLEELEIPYEIRFYQRDPQTMLAPKALRDIHPLGKSPVLTDGPLTIAESGAIIEYLLDTYGKERLRPAPGTDEFLKYRYFLHYAEGSLMPPLLLKLIFSRMADAASAPFFLRPLVKKIADQVMHAFVNPQLKIHMNFLEDTLAKSPWFAGAEFTAADIQMSFPLEAAVSRAGANAKPHLQKFIERIQARPAYQEALQKGGPLTLG